MEKVHEPKAPTWNDLDSEWVPFPNGKLYLLPRVDGGCGGQKYVPVFDNAGDVTLQMRHPAKDEIIPQVLDSFLDLMGTFYRDQQPWLWSDEMCGQFFRVVRHLLNRNYAFTNAQLSELLTVSPEQLTVLFNAMFKHILRK